MYTRLTVMMSALLLALFSCSKADTATNPEELNEPQPDSYQWLYGTGSDYVPLDSYIVQDATVTLPDGTVYRNKGSFQENGTDDAGQEKTYAYYDEVCMVPGIATPIILRHRGLPESEYSSMQIAYLGPSGTMAKATPWVNGWRHAAINPEDGSIFVLSHNGVVHFNKELSETSRAELPESMMFAGIGISGPDNRLWLLGYGVEENADGTTRLFCQVFLYGDNNQVVFTKREYELGLKTYEFEGFTFEVKLQYLGPWEI